MTHFSSILPWDASSFEQVGMEFLSKLASILLLLFVFFIAKKIILYIFKKAILTPLLFTKENSGRKDTLSHLMVNILDYFLYFLLVYWILAIIGIPVTGLLAGAGITGLAIGLGAQGFLSDLVNGFSILLEHQFDVGETIKIGNISGIVQSMGLRNTQIRDFDGSIHYVPNRMIDIVTNLSRNDMRVTIDIPLYSNTDLDLVYAAVQEVNKREQSHHPDVTREPMVLGPLVLPNGNFVFRIRLFTTNGQQVAIYHEFYRLYQTALLKNGVTLPTTITR